MTAAVSFSRPRPRRKRKRKHCPSNINLIGGCISHIPSSSSEGNGVVSRVTRAKRRRLASRVGDKSNWHTSVTKVAKEAWNEKQLSGFCSLCTNPYKLISCYTCYRSWHIHCLMKHLFKGNPVLQQQINGSILLSQQAFVNKQKNHSHDLKKPPRFNLSGNNKHPFGIQVSPAPAPAPAPAVTYTEDIDMDNNAEMEKDSIRSHSHTHSHSHDTGNNNNTHNNTDMDSNAVSDICSIAESNAGSDHSNSTNNVVIPESDLLTVMNATQIQTTAKPALFAAADDDEKSLSETDTRSDNASSHRSDSDAVSVNTAHSSNPLTIELQSLNCESADTIFKWFEHAFPLIQQQQVLHTNWLSKQIMAVLQSCQECQQNAHSCCICNRIYFNGDMSSAAHKASKCKQRICGYYYHPQCLAQDRNYAKHTKFTKNQTFMCPRHHCWACFEDEIPTQQQSSSVRKYCAYCPRSYHRGCVLPTAACVSVQIIENNDTMLEYPDFRFDLIDCGDDHCRQHAPPTDKQFGRDDNAVGIFKFEMAIAIANVSASVSVNADADANANESERTKGATVTEFQFHRLYTTKFSIPTKWIDEYDTRSDQIVHNPFPTNFKYITKSKWKKVQKKKKKKKSADSEFDQCQCRDHNGGCQLNMRCANFMVQEECYDDICGCKDPLQCLNRQFVTCDTTTNVDIRGTDGCGYGAFARQAFTEGQLILEYVGEVISREESQQRLRQMNARAALHFYFFQVDRQTVIDATHMGNEARFLNHSCQPNCKTQIWNVRNEERLGIFAAVDIEKGEELTYDYQYEVENPDITTLAECLCGSDNCRRYLGLNKRQARDLIAKEEQQKREIDAEFGRKGSGRSGPKLSKKQQRQQRQETKQKSIMNDISNVISAHFESKSKSKNNHNKPNAVNITSTDTDEAADNDVVLVDESAESKQTHSKPQSLLCAN